MRDAVDALNVEQRTTAAWHMWSGTRQRRRSMRLKTLNDVRRGTNRRNAAGAMQRAQCSGRQTRQQPTLRASSATRRCTAFQTERGHSNGTPDGHRSQGGGTPGKAAIGQQKRRTETRSYVWPSQQITGSLKTSQHRARSNHSEGLRTAQGVAPRGCARCKRAAA